MRVRKELLRSSNKGLDRGHEDVLFLDLLEGNILRTCYFKRASMPTSNLVEFVIGFCSSRKTDQTV